VGVGEASPHRIALEQALPLTVGEIMIAHPKTFPSDGTVGDVRQAFDSTTARTVSPYTATLAASPYRPSRSGVAVKRSISSP
jgi:hypothetical protein